MSATYKPVSSWDSCTWCGDDFKKGTTPWNEHGYCSETCERNSSEFREKKYKEEQLAMAKKKQVTIQDIKDYQEKSKAQEAEKAADVTADNSKVNEQAKAAAPAKKEAGPAKMAHGAVQDKGNPPTDPLPEGWQYVWHDPYTYDGKNGPITVRGHWEKAKKSPPKPKAAEKKAEASSAGTESPKDQAPAESGSSQSEQK